MLATQGGVRDAVAVQPQFVTVSGVLAIWQKCQCITGPRASVEAADAARIEQPAGCRRAPPVVVSERSRSLVLRGWQRLVVSADRQRRRARRYDLRHRLRARVKSPAEAGAQVPIRAVRGHETVGRRLGQFFDALRTGAVLSGNDPEAVRVLQPPVAWSGVLQPTASLLRKDGTYGCGQYQPDNHPGCCAAAPRAQATIRIGENAAPRGVRRAKSHPAV